MLVVSSESLDLPSLALVDRGLRATFGTAPGGRPDVYTEVLDTVRFPDSGFQREQAAWLQRKYAGRRLDLIVVLGAPALRLVAAPGGDPAARPFPGAPVVFGLIGPDQVAAAPAADVTGVWLTYDFAPTMEALLRLQPGAREVVVVAGSGSYDAYVTDLARRQLAPYGDRVRLTYLNDLAFPEQLVRVAALPPDAAVFLLSMTRDVAGGQFVSAEASGQVAAAAGAPVYAPFDVYLGRGIVGGAVIHYELQGAEIAGLAGQVLAGAPGAALPPARAGTNPYVFDWRQLRRWGLREDRLPPGSEVRFKELSVWERYRAPIAGAAGLVVVETALIAALLTERHRRRQAQAAERAAQGQRLALAQELTHLSRVATVGELGASLAHELTQPLAAIRANAEAGRRFLAAPGAGGPDLDEVDAILADIGADDERAAAVIARLRALLRQGAGGAPAARPQRGRGRDGHAGGPRRGAARGGHRPRPGARSAPGARRPGAIAAGGAQPPAQRPRAPPPAPRRRAARGGRSPCGRAAAAAARGGRWSRGGGRGGGRAGQRAGARPGDGRAACSSRSTPPNPTAWGWAWPSSRTIAEAHGGRLRAENHPTGGAEFTLTLPAVAPLTPAGPRPAAPPRRRGGERSRAPPVTPTDGADPVVCLVDDDASVRRALERLLRAGGYRTATFASAGEFLQYARRAGPEVVGCLVLDVQLPGLSGLDLQPALAEAGLDLPIVFITGHGDIPMSVRAMKAGAVDFLPKPVAADALLEAVGQALARGARARAGQDERREARRRLDTLTPREREVLSLVTTGRLNKQIAAALGISLKTVKVHRARALEKLGAASVAEAVRTVDRAGGAGEPDAAPTARRRRADAGGAVARRRGARCPRRARRSKVQYRAPPEGSTVSGRDLATSAGAPPARRCERGGDARPEAESEASR